MFKNSALFGTSFPLVKIAPKVRGYVIDCSEFCVLFRGTRSESMYIPIYNIFAVYRIIYKIIIIALELLNIAKKTIGSS